MNYNLDSVMKVIVLITFVLTVINFFYLQKVKDNTSLDEKSGWSSRVSTQLSPYFTFVASNAMGTVLIACSQDDKVLVSTDSGTTWVDQELAPHQYMSVASDDTGTILAAVAFDSYSTGVIYVKRNGVWAEKRTGGGFSCVSMSDAGDFIYVSQMQSPTGGLSGSILKSTDYGDTWTSVDINAPYNSLFRVVCSKDGQNVYAAFALISPEGVYKSLDFGATFNFVSFPGVSQPLLLTSVSTLATNQTGKYVLAGGFPFMFPQTDGIMSSSDFGTAYNKVFEGPIAAVASDDSGKFLIAVTTESIILSSDFGVTWTTYTPKNFNFSDEYKYAGNLSGCASSRDGKKLVVVSTGGNIFTFSR